MQNTKIKNLYRLIAKTAVCSLIAALAFTSNITLLSNNHAEAASIDAIGSSKVDDEILWFARTIYSESKKYEEQTLVAWVIRNRVESGLYGDSYEEVVLARGQFSGMHATDRQYSINISLQYGDTSPAWDSALSIARSVYYADAALNPLSTAVMHFYSPISVANTPTWALGLEPAHTVHDAATSAVRFAFYAIN